MFKSRLLLPLFVCLLVLCGADGAYAQERYPLEVSGGYQYVLDIDTSDDAESTVTQFKNGFSASAGWNVLRRLAVVGEFSKSATTIEVGESFRFAPIDRTVYTTMGGARYRFGGLFVQALFGQFAVKTHAEQLLGTLDETTTDFAFQPGIGFDVAEHGRVWGRIQVDYRKLLSSDAPSVHEFRVGAAVVVGLGGRQNESVRYAPRLLCSPAVGGLEPGMTIGAYALGHQPGEGGMGTVYRAIDTRLNRAVAIKFLSTDEIGNRNQIFVQPFPASGASIR